MTLTMNQLKIGSGVGPHYAGELSTRGAQVNINAVCSCPEIIFLRVLAGRYGEQNLINVWD